MEDEGAKDIDRVYKPIDPKVVELDIKLKSMEINNELEVLKMQDPSIDEIELLNLANQEGIPIKKAYTMWRGQNVDKILKDALAKQSAQLTEQIKNTNSKVTTMINPMDKTSDATFGLSEAEMRMADKLEMTYSEYKKWR